MQKILNVFALLLVSVCPVFADGISLYTRNAIEKDGELSFPVESKKGKPAFNEAVLKCISPLWAHKGTPISQEACITKLFKSPTLGIDAEKSGNLKAWKWFIVGTAYFELRDFSNATNAFEKTFSLASDSKLKPAALHRLICTQLILRNQGAALKLLDTMKKSFPKYNEYDETFETYPYCLCDHSWINGLHLTSISELEKLRPIFTDTAKAQEKIKLLSSNKDVTASDIINAQVELAKLYEKYCPIQTMFERICPDAVSIYKTVLSSAPSVSGSDYAFLRIQESKFAYEYEGDMKNYSEDVLRLYGPFLERFPQSVYAEEIRVKYNKAQQTLKSEQKNER